MSDIVPLHIWQTLCLYTSVRHCAFTHLAGIVPLHICQTLCIYTSVRHCAFTYLADIVPLHICQTLCPYKSGRHCVFTHLSDVVPLHMSDIVFLHICQTLCLYTSVKHCAFKKGKNSIISHDSFRIRSNLCCYTFRLACERTIFRLSDTKEIYTFVAPYFVLVLFALRSQLLCHCLGSPFFLSTDSMQRSI